MKKNLFDENFNLDPTPAPVNYQDEAQPHKTRPTTETRYIHNPKGEVEEVTIPARYDFETALANAKQNFQGYKKRIEDMAFKVKSFKVNSDTSAAELTNLVGQAAELAKTLEEKRKQTIKEPDTYVRKLNAFVKTFREILTEPKRKTGIVELAKKKIGDYQFQKELERRKAEKAGQEEQAKLQAKMDAEAKAAGVEAPQMPAFQMPKSTGPIRTEAGSANFGTEWTYEVEDLDKVPVDFLMVDDKKAMAAIKAGIREIPGLIIKEVPKVRIRTR